MTKLDKLYSSINNLEELGLELTHEMLLECDKLEEQIIKNEILPALGQDIEPHWNTSRPKAVFQRVVKEGISPSEGDMEKEVK